MARGKYKNKAQQRRRRELAAEIAELERQIDEERQRRATVEAREVVVERLVEEFHVLEAELAQRGADALADVDEALAELERRRDEIEPVATRAKQIKTAMVEKLMTSLEGPYDLRLEVVTNMMGLSGKMLMPHVSSPEAKRNLRIARGSNAAWEDLVGQISRASGGPLTEFLDEFDEAEVDRRGDALVGFSRLFKIAAANDVLPGRLLPNVVLTTKRHPNGERVARETLAAVRTYRDAALLRSWDADDDACVAAFESTMSPVTGWSTGRGANIDWIGSADETPTIPRVGPWPADAPTLPELRDRLHRSEREYLNQFDYSKRLQFPNDAVALQHLYSRSLRAQYLSSADRFANPKAHLTKPSTWIDESALDADAQRLGVLDAQMVRAIPHWLPFGQTSAFAESRPLTDHDRDDIRLPFPACLLVPAEPIQCEPAAPSTISKIAAERVFRAEAALIEQDSFLNTPETRTDKHHTVPVHSHGLIAERGLSSSVRNAVAVNGAYIEAILLLADAEGRLIDDVVFCIAVPRRSSIRGCLGRAAVASRLSTSSQSDAIWQLAAAISFADWLEPNDTESRDVQHAHGAANAEVGPIRILDTRATYSSEQTSRPAPERSVTPHLRRAHWRLVRVGSRHDWETHRSYRRVRIPATAVNSGRSVMKPQVYRISEPPTPTPTAPSR